MKSTGALLLSLLPAMLAAATVAPTAPSADRTPASQGAPASDYTGDATQEPLVPEYDPALAPAMAEPSDDDGLRECVSVDGVPIYTDRRCSDMGAMPHVVLPPIGGAAAGLPTRVKTCARNQTMLLDGVRAALESHDVNRLADYYHWSGMGSTEGYRLMDRLDAFAERQVVDVRLVREAQPAEPDIYADRFDPLPDLPPPPAQDEDGTPAPPGTASPPPRRRPLASMLRVDQMRSASDVSANVTYFHLLTNAGCWWMRF